MIRVTRQPEPKPPHYDFDRDVRKRGEDTIRQLAGLPPLYGPWPGKKIAKKVDSVAEVTTAMIRKYHRWTRAMPALHAAYGGVCAYEARYIELIDNPTTDHFMPLDSTISLAHEWNNYRLASVHANSLKSNKKVLDPFSIKYGWFAIDFTTYKTIAGPTALYQAARIAIADTIKILGLDGARMTEHRKRQARLYFGKKMTFSLLRRQEPFLAGEIARTGRLLKGDR